jgi:HPP family
MVALRLLIQSVLLIGVIGVVGHFAGLVMVTSTTGPTAYLMLAHPDDVTARVRNAVAGHGVAIGFGLACAAAFGIWQHRPVTPLGNATLDQAGATALATAVTLAALTVMGSHHAPAAATAMLVSSGIAAPGRPLYGLVAGLVLVMILASAFARLPGARKRTIELED